MKETDSEETFSKIMSNSRLVVPFTDFDDKVMGIIETNLSKKASISRDIKLSWIFFILGSSFGIILTIFLPMIQQPVLGLHFNKLKIPILIIISFLILTQLDSLIDFYKKQKIQTKR